MISIVHLFLCSFCVGSSCIPHYLLHENLVWNSLTMIWNVSLKLMFPNIVFVLNMNASESHWFMFVLNMNASESHWVWLHTHTTMHLSMAAYFIAKTCREMFRNVGFPQCSLTRSAIRIVSDHPHSASNVSTQHQLFFTFCFWERAIVICATSNKLVMLPAMFVWYVYRL